ncbi:hypothetical protein [Paraclostridium sordellii]|uniref:hypothetical protein n=1 Tax=Paraclostridium sordellii TaxID=1505 RepID=UPI0005DC7040|nr:hypothetical protein [Paeniclostridium sordellii]CEP45230.1 Uncharacterised protein [[Clostridium] sordellii] [Paeniclostridium sordellii]
MITKERKEQVWADNAPLLELIYRVEKIMLKEHIYILAKNLYGAEKKDIDKCLEDCLEVGFLKRKQIGLQNKYMFMLTKYPIMKIEGKNNTREVATIVPSSERIKLSLLKTEYLISKNTNDMDMFNTKIDSIWNVNKTESLKVFEYLESLKLPMSKKFTDDYKLEKLKYKRLKKIATEDELKEIKDIQKENKRRTDGLKNNRVQTNEGKPIANLLHCQELYTISNFLGNGFRINQIKKINDVQIRVQVIYYNLSQLDTGNVYKNIALFYNLLKNYFELEKQEIILQTFFYGAIYDINKFNLEGTEIKKNFYTGTLCKNKFYKNKLLAYGVEETDLNSKRIVVRTKELDFRQYNLSLVEI